nr:MAG TPA: hypothetical protein [Caudoviricetes sp.]
MRLEGGSSPPLPREGYTKVTVPLPDGAINCRIAIISKHSDDVEVNRRSKQLTLSRGKQRGRK